MVTSTNLYTKSGKILVVLYLLLFPFGQLLRFGGDKNYGNLQDIIVLCSLPFYFWPYSLYPKIDKYVRYFFYISLFSTLLSLNYFSSAEVIYGSLYLFRIIAYYAFGVLIYNLVRLKIFRGSTLLNSLILISVISAFFGWVQYLLIPDLVFLKYMNWDDHLYRLVGTFLDPGFAGIILVFSVLISLQLYQFSARFNYLVAYLFLLVTLLFTYSRASYLSMVIGLFSLAYFERKLRKIAVVTVVLFLLGLFIIPKTEGEGVKLLRTASVNARVSNYTQTLDIIKTYPVFGIGFNNLCAIRVKMYGVKEMSHACSGSDSSILFILSTTGIVGLLVFLRLVSESIYISDSVTKVLFVSIITAVFIHSLFVQSLFYSFVMGYLVVFFGSIGKIKE